MDTTSFRINRDSTSEPNKYTEVTKRERRIYWNKKEGEGEEEEEEEEEQLTYMYTQEPCHHCFSTCAELAQSTW